MEVADILTGVVADILELLEKARKTQDTVIFEGSQGTLLDIDQGSCPYVTSLNTISGGVTTGAGICPSYLDYTLGIVKAYSTQVKAGPLPTELFSETRELLCRHGNEYGTKTGRRRRISWLDTVALRRAVQVNSLSGACLTKLDVLDGLKETKICTGYRIPNGQIVKTTPILIENLNYIKPIYDALPGWSETTLDIKILEDLPESARQYINRIEAIIDVPVDTISTGTDHRDTIILRDPLILDRNQKRKLQILLKLHVIFIY